MGNANSLDWNMKQTGWVYSKKQGAGNKPMPSNKLLNALRTWSENSETEILQSKVQKGRLRIYHNNQALNVKNSRNFHYFDMSNKHGRAGGANEWISYGEHISIIIGVGFLSSIVWSMNIPKSDLYVNVSTLPKQKNYPSTTMRVRVILAFLFAPLELSPGSFSSPTAPKSRNRSWDLSLPVKETSIKWGSKIPSNHAVEFDIFANKLDIIPNDPYKRDHPMVSSWSCVVTKRVVSMILSNDVVTYWILSQVEVLFQRGSTFSIWTHTLELSRILRHSRITSMDASSI